MSDDSKPEETPKNLDKEEGGGESSKIDITKYYDPETAASIISKNSKKHIEPEYVRTLSRYKKIRKVKITGRASLYLKEDVDKYIVEARGVKAARAKKGEKMSSDVTGLYEIEGVQVLVFTEKGNVIAITQDGRRVPPMDIVTNGRKIRELTDQEKDEHR